MEFFLDENTVKTLKPFGVAAIGLAAIAAIAFAFNKFREQDENQQHEEGQVPSKRKPAGIYNEGNTCFVNSLLQALAPLKSFVHNLQQLTQYRDGSNNHHQQLLIKLKEALMRINKEQGSVEIRDFLESVSNFSQIINLQQQDAYELFSIIVASVENIYNQNKNMSLNRSTFSIVETDLEQTFVNCSVSQEKQQQIANTLLGYTKTSILCQGCLEQINTKIHAFYNLSFDISSNKIRTLEDAINHFQQKQYIEGWTCTNCSLKQHLHKLTRVRKQISQRKPEHHELLIAVGRKIEEFLNKKSHNQLEIHELNGQLGNFVKLFEKEYIQVGDKNMYRDQIFVQITPVTKTIIKQCVISKFPKILAIHLKQLSMNPITGELVLLRKHVQFPKNLKIEVKKGVKSYQLLSLIAHTGNESQGHYFTFRKMDSQSNNWFCISDTNSFECKELFLKAHMPYMLFYQLSQ